jgi:hypothetical protein
MTFLQKNIPEEDVIIGAGVSSSATTSTANAAADSPKKKRGRPKKVRMICCFDSSFILLFLNLLPYF